MRHHNEKHRARHHYRRQALMLQRIAQDERVTGDKHDGQNQQQPTAQKNAVMSGHDFHLVAKLAEITRGLGPPLSLSGSLRRLVRVEHADVVL